MPKKPPQTEYEGSAYIGVVGPDGEYGSCRDTIEAIIRRPDDSPLRYLRATKGYEARQQHINNFLDTHHDFILLLDHDQTFPRHTLERLRSHKLPYVSGFYMRRQTDVMSPVWYRPNPREQWPMMPWIGRVERGKLHPLGASGWGCVLIHRDVVLGVRALLKGEWEVLEDDMDVEPYDLARIMDAIHGLDSLVTSGNLHPVAVRAFVEVLKEEIVPLRGDTWPVGSDIRFPFYARRAGFQLYGDPDVACGHTVHYPISLSDYDLMSDAKIAEIDSKVTAFLRNKRREMGAKVKELKNG